MTKKQHNKCNHMARLFYRSMGYQVDTVFDFSDAHHPQEVSCWNQALIAHDVMAGTGLTQSDWVDPRERIQGRFK